MNYDYIGAIKIKDGLFLGDQFAAQVSYYGQIRILNLLLRTKFQGLLQSTNGFLLNSQFYHHYENTNRIIECNCASKQIPNHWESIGIVYMSFPWMDNDQQVIFQQDEIINNVMKFVDDALNNGESVIVLSVKGHNRSVATLCVYFMKKYRWTLYKTLQYMHNRRPDLEIRAHFFNQLLSVETRLQKQGYGAKTYNWDEIHTQGENDEIVLRNTYLNSQAQGVAEFKDHDPKPKESKLRFAEKVSMYIPPYDKVVFSKTKSLAQDAKPIIKQSGSSKQIDPSFQQQTQKQQSITIYDQSNQQPQKESQKQSLNQIYPAQPQRPSSQGTQQQRLTKSDSVKSGSMFDNNVVQPQRVQMNNFMDSREQFLQKSQQQNGTRRPQTAPNQLKAPRVQTTPYKRNTSSGQRQEAGSQPNSQFKPMRQRAQSPNSAYNSSNPYIQRQFKAKAWKK